jgi:hypothetical protein
MYEGRFEDETEYLVRTLLERYIYIYIHLYAYVDIRSISLIIETLTTL